MSADRADFSEGHEPRRGRLMVSGTLLSLTGCCLGLGAAGHLFLMLYLPSATALGVGEEGEGSEFAEKFFLYSQAASAAFFGLAAAAFLAAGLGSIFLKRWSRPLALVLSGGWLYMGSIMLAAYLVSGPAMRRAMTEGMPETTAGGSGPSMEAVFGFIIAGMVAASFVFGVLLPLLLLWLNWHRDVRLTLEHCDPKPRWTDRCPVPVLGIVLGAGAAAISCLLLLAFPWFPVFGHTLTGASARIAAGILVALLLLIAWGSWRRSHFAWAGAVVLVLGGGAASLLTSRHLDLSGMYREMGMSEDLVEVIAGPGSVYHAMMQDSGSMGMMTAASLLPLLGYLVWARRYFSRGGGERPGT